MPRPRPEQAPKARTESLVVHALEQYRLGNPEHAAAMIEAAQSIGAAGPGIDGAARAIVSTLRSALLLAAGAFEEARAELAAAAAWRARVPMPTTVPSGQAAAAMMCWLEGDVPEARRRTRELMARNWDTGMAWFSSVYFLDLAWLAADEGDLDRAVDLLTATMNRVEDADYRLPVQCSLLWLADFEHRRGHDDRARAWLERLDAALAGQASPSFLIPMRDRVAMAVIGSTQMSTGPAIEALSEREFAVLRRLSTEDSLEAVARAMYVSLNTVKTHVRAIYRKLGVNSREQAVERARHLGLLRRGDLAA
jgi:LuxR family maltose regulon positive regulatory protein